VSLKDRIREAQIEAAKRLSPDSRRSGKGAASDSKGADGDGPKAPTVEEIRLALLRKTANGKTIE
jgi:hypothetical protein